MKAQKAHFKKTSATPKYTTLGFGFQPQLSEHHYLVNVMPDTVRISEQFEYAENEARRDALYQIGDADPRLRVILPRAKWDAIKDAVAYEFNPRLKDMGLKLGKFTTGYNMLARLFGKEMLLLAWAIEDAEPGVIPVAIRNWQGLKPEERWWLTTMTNAATGQAIAGKNRGWRKSVRFAMTENPVSDMSLWPQALEDRL